jgi:Domain of unknown function (DUF1707)
VDDSETRASDAERDQVARLLRDHWAVGRLTEEELDERLTAVYAARTWGELRVLTRDLPETLSAPVSAGASSGAVWPGVKPFHEERRLSAAPRDAYAMALREIVPRMAERYFRLTHEDRPRRLSFAGPMGQEVTVMFLPAIDGGTKVSASGRAKRAVRKAFANLRD